MRPFFSGTNSTLTESRSFSSSYVNPRTFGVRSLRTRMQNALKSERSPSEGLGNSAEEWSQVRPKFPAVHQDKKHSICEQRNHSIFVLIRRYLDLNTTPGFCHWWIFLVGPRPPMPKPCIILFVSSNLEDCPQLPKSVESRDAYQSWTTSSENVKRFYGRYTVASVATRLSQKRLETPTFPVVGWHPIIVCFGKNRLKAYFSPLLGVKKVQGWHSRTTSYLRQSCLRQTGFQHQFQKHVVVNMLLVWANYVVHFSVKRRNRPCKHQKWTSNDKDESNLPSHTRQWKKSTKTCKMCKRNTHRKRDRSPSLLVVTWLACWLQIPVMWANIVIKILGSSFGVMLRICHLVDKMYSIYSAEQPLW